jgi:hypothetical protein
MNASSSATMVATSVTTSSSETEHVTAL